MARFLWSGWSFLNSSTSRFSSFLCLQTRARGRKRETFGRSWEESQTHPKKKREKLDASGQLIDSFIPVADYSCVATGRRESSVINCHSGPIGPAANFFHNPLILLPVQVLKKCWRPRCTLSCQGRMAAKNTSPFQSSPAPQFLSFRARAIDGH